MTRFRLAAAARILLALALALGTTACDGVPRASAETGVGGATGDPRASDAEGVVLRSQKAAGVPVHRREHDHAVSARVANGTRVAVLGWGKAHKWLRIRAPSGVTGWVTARYVEREPRAASASASASAGAPGTAASAAAPRPSPAAVGALEGSGWESLEGCRRALGGRAVRRAGRARVATWNIRWFPDGTLGNGDGKRATNIAWLACAIALLDVDVIALQEIKGHSGARAKMAELVRALDSLTGGRWRSVLDACDGGARQKVGFLFDSRRVSRLDGQDVAAFNADGTLCGGQLRPGHDLYARFKGGADVHLVAIHQKSGPRQKSYRRRQAALGRWSDGHEATQALAIDADVIVLGDFNTMGCRTCVPVVSAASERQELERVIGELSTPYRLLPSRPACSEYYKGHAGLLDHVAVSSSMVEVPADATVEVSGYCRALRCADVPPADMPRAYTELSDHCPLILEFDDVDRDD